MSEEKENINPENKEIMAKPLKKSFFKRLFKWVFILFVGLILLLIAIFFFIQTDAFDKIVLGYALDKVNETYAAKDSKIYAESLEGNLFKGFILKNGHITVKGDTLIQFESIKADYDIWKLFDKGISLQTLIIQEPQIILTEIRDKNNELKLNLLYFLESDVKNEDTTKFEFDWDVSAEHVVIQRGSVRIFGENTSKESLSDLVMDKLDSFELKNFEMSSFFLDMGVNYSKNTKDIDIKNISFRTNSDFNVNKLSFYSSINKIDTSTLVKNFFLETDRSSLQIPELFVNQLNPFDEIIYEDFKDKFTRINIDFKQFNFKDLVFFFPGIDFLDSTAALNLVANGIYSDLQIQNLDLKTPNSTFSFDGKIKNLDHPSDIYFDIRGKNIGIDPHDTRLVIPGLDVPDYSYAGRIIIPSITYVGEPDRFSSDFDIRTNAGNAMGNIYFDLTQSVIRYKGDFSTTGLNIGMITKDKELESNINGSFIVDARGFDYRTATGKLNYSVNRTRFFGQNIASSDGLLNFNRGNIDLNITYNSDAVKTKTAGKINVSNLKNISYDLKGTASNLNIAAFTKDNSQRSDLSFDFDVRGSGFDPDNIAGSYKINMNSSTYADFKIPATPIDLEIDHNGNVKKLNLKTNFADVSAEGTFNFSSMAEIINANVEKIASEFESNRFNDSISEAQNTGEVFTAICKDLNLKYTVSVRDLAPISTFTGNDTIDFKGSLSGTMIDSCGVFAFTSKGFVNKFSYGDSLFIVKDTLLIDINVKNDITADRLTRFEANADISSDKLIISKMLIDTTKINLSFFDNKNHFLISTNRDSTVMLYSDGSLEDSLLVKFDSLAVRYKDFLVTNNKDLLIKYNTEDSSEWIEFRQFSLNNVNQRLSVAGKYSLTDSSNVKVSADNVKISTYQILLNEDIDTSNLISGNLRRLELIYTGTFEDPDFHLEANSDVLLIGGTRIGRLDAFIDYKDDNLVPDIAFFNINNTGSFKLTGSIPYLNPFVEENNDSAVRVRKIADKQVNINAVAKNFQLKVIQQMLPYTANLEGILDGRINLTGTPESPTLTGDMDVNGGKVYVTLNKMNYNFNAKLSTQSEKLLINYSKLYVEDEPSRFITTTGFIDFTNLTINDIQLGMTGDVKAFDKDNGQTELGISGDLYVGSGSPQLTLKGNSDRFDLIGNLILVKGNVVFNPFIQEAYNIYSDDFTYGIIIDSVKTEKEPKGKVLMESTDSVVVISNLNLDPFERILYISNNSQLKKMPRQESGKFFYDLYITTQDNVFLKFIVNEKTQQEFFGEIRTDLHVDNKENYQMGGRGVVTLGNNCYYQFFRKFDASGKATFNGSITNPELDIEAQYKGITSTGTGTTNSQNLEEVVIDLDVSGSASNPSLAITIDRGGLRESGSDATSDAISFLLFGKFQDQLTFEQSTSFGANLGASFLSNILSSQIEAIAPWIINTNVNYVDSKSGSFANNTDIRFTAAIGDAIVRFGGQIFRGITNTDIVIDYPLNKIFKLQSLSNNLILRLEKVYDPFDEQNDVANTSGTRQGALIYYRIKF